MNNKNNTNLCTICHRSFSNTLSGNRMMCPGCRIQKRECGHERGHKESFIVVTGRRMKMAG